MLSDVTSRVLDVNIPEDSKRDAWNFEGLCTSVGAQFGILWNINEVSAMTGEAITQKLTNDVKLKLEQQKKSLGQFYEQLQQMLLLQSIDQKWKEHLAKMDKLKEGINLRGYAQKDPIVEYRKEAFLAFERLTQAIQSELVEKLLKIQIVSEESAQAMKQMMQEPDMDEFNFQGSEASENTNSFSSLAPQASPATRSEDNGKQKMRMTAGPSRQSERPMNRNERRKAEKGRR